MWQVLSKLTALQHLALGTQKVWDLAPLDPLTRLTLLTCTFSEVSTAA